eukprot:TRINITY_DN238_c0_g2_i1.p1 TRINITY_DN238_c0_g2~~TRINITY_DN238_c0_g2_i1.p1  ORF type:complete len:127 (-),score=27.54 TRINITY_DN238_c0_g2_i1:21-401(-)
MTKPTILLFGLPATHHSIPEALREKIAAMLASLEGELNKEAPDLNFHFVPVQPEDSQEKLDEIFSKFPKIDGYVIGNGVRSNMELTPFMERVIDRVRQVAPQAKVMFNTIPTDTIVAIRRWFPKPE